MDDRFNFILFSNALQENNDYNYIDDSYTAYVYDGQNFNNAINDVANTAVPDTIVEALYNASDHLPVYLNFIVSEPSVFSKAARINMDGYKKIGKFFI